MYVWEKWLCVRGRNGSHWLVVIYYVFRRLSPFFVHVQKGFPGFASGQSIFIHVVWVHSSSMSSLMSQSMYLFFCRKKFCIL